MNRNESEINPDEIKFEEGISKLEKMVEALERGELNLEESIEYFKKSSKLYGILQKKLKESDAEIKKILEDFEGNIIIQNLEDE